MAKKTIFIKSSEAQYSDAELSVVITEFLSTGRLNHYGLNNDLNTIQDTAGASMNVIVKKGACVVEITRDGETFKTVNFSTADETLQCSPNSSGITRYDTIIGRVNVSAVPNSLKNNIFTVEKLEGLSGSTPTGTILTDDDIQAIVGSDGWIRLSDITIASGATTITTSNIDNISNTVEMGQDTNNYQTIHKGDGSNLSGVVTERRDNDLAGVYNDYHNDYQNSYKRLATFQSDETWTGSSADTSNYLTGSQAIKISPNGAEDTATFTTTLDMSQFSDGSSSLKEDDIKFALYADSISNLTACGIRFRTSGGNEFYYSAHASVAVGWNYFTIAKSAFSETGSPSWGNITEIELYGATSSGEVNLSFTALNLTRNIGITGCLYEKRKSSTNNTATSGYTLTIGSNDLTDRFAGEDYSGYYIRINNSISGGYGQEYLISSNTDNTITTSTSLPTINSNVDWEIWKADFDEQDGFWIFSLDDGYNCYSNIKKTQTTTGLNIFQQVHEDCSIYSLFKRLYSTSNNTYGLVFRYQDVNNYYFIKQDASDLKLYRKEDNNDVLLASATNSTDADTNTYLKVESSKYNIKVLSSSDGVSWTKEIEVADSEFITGKTGYLFTGSATNHSNKIFSIYDVKYADIAQVAYQLHDSTAVTSSTRITDSGILGEDVVANDILAWGDYNPQDDLLDLSVQDTEVTIGYAADQLVTAFRVKLTADGSPEYIKLMLKKTGTPTMPLNIQLYLKDASNIYPDFDNIVAGCYPVFASALTTSLAEYTLPLSKFTALTTSSDLWIVMWTKQAADTSNYYSVGVASSNTNADASYYKHTGIASATHTQISTNDPYIVLGTYAENNRLYKLDLDFPEKSLRYAGTAIAAGSAGESCTFVKTGKMGGFTSLTKGRRYYASTTAGGVSLTAPFKGPFVDLGIALSTTEIDLQPEVKIIYSTLSAVGGGNDSWTSTLFEHAITLYYSFYTGYAPQGLKIASHSAQGSYESGSLGVLEGEHAMCAGGNINSGEYYPTAWNMLGRANTAASDYYIVNYVAKTNRGITLSCLDSDNTNQTTIISSLVINI